MHTGSNKLGSGKSAANTGGERKVHLFYTFCRFLIKFVCLPSTPSGFLSLYRSVINRLFISVDFPSPDSPSIIRSNINQRINTLLYNNYNHITLQVYSHTIVI